MPLLRHEIGDVLRDVRQLQGRTLREVSHDARVSLGYLSEVERGQKEASSELLASICQALDIPLSYLLREVSDRLVEQVARLTQALRGADLIWAGVGWMIAAVALIPTLAFIFMGMTQQIPFGGTSIIIIVGVGLDTVKQVDAQLQQRHYEGFLR